MRPPLHARLRDSVWTALLWRYATHAAMLALCVANEARPAPSMPDTVLAAVPRVDWIAHHNYHLWLAAYLPVGLWLWRLDRARFLDFLYLGGWLSLLRGVCVVLTGLGPVDGVDVNAGAAPAELFAAWVDLVNPIPALTTDVAHLTLTKDLFFSGHTATTFLLYLYCRDLPRIGPVALAGHLVTVAVVFLAHLHYTIDVVGAWALTAVAFELWRRRGSVRTRRAALPVP